MTDERRNRDLVDEVARFVSSERERLSGDGIEVSSFRSPDHLDKTSAGVDLARLPHATAELIVWDSGEAELAAAWGERGPGDWEHEILRHFDFASVAEVRAVLDQLPALVCRDDPPNV
jgi:hypothetical protein